MRRTVLGKLYKEYKKEFCDEHGNQEPNLSKEVMEGIDSLSKRKSKKEVIIMKTDKSSKLTITNEEEYRKMGEKHTKKDIKIQRNEVNRIGKILNGHSAEWARMHSSGENHGHTGRIITSKKTHSDNTGDLYMMHKDHKEKDGEVRPTATGNTSNTWGFSNSVSDLLESAANSEPDPYELISSEDMLARSKVGNEKIKKWREEWFKKIR